MNKTKIDWADYTWNPVVGCTRGCWYCYAKKIFERFNPSEIFEAIHIYPGRMLKPLLIKKPSRIFTGSMTDMGNPGIPRSCMERILQTIEKCPQHMFIFITKFIEGYWNLPRVPQNLWLGITITGTESEYFGMEKSNKILKEKSRVKFLNFEPLLGPVEYTIQEGLDWIIVGGLTGPKPKDFKTDYGEVERIVRKARGFGIPVFLKDNLGYHEKIKEYPIDMDNGI
jgi:protein gp37